MAGKLELYDWADRAAKHVWFLPDRAGVRKELQNHMEDRYEALTAGGLDERAAAARTVAAMGDADEVGEALNKIHSPLLGWAWLLSKVLVIFLAALSAGLVLTSGLRGVNQIRAEETAARQGVWMFQQTEYEDMERLLLTKGKDQAICGDYALTLAEAARWRGGDQELDYLRLRVERPFFVPVLEENALRGGLRVTDDRGNRWDARDMDYYDTPLSPRSEFAVIRIVPERGEVPARWYEVSYDRGGYQFTLHIDMKEEGI